MTDTVNKIANWDKDPANNDDTSPAGAAEGIAPSTVNNIIREVMAVIRTEFNDAEWFEYRDGTKAGIYTYVSATEFKVTGADVSDHYHIGRRVKVVGSSTGTVYDNITAVSYNTGDTTVTMETGGLVNEALTVYTSILSASNHALPVAVIEGVVDTIFSGNTGSKGTLAVSLVPESGSITLNTNFNTLSYTDVGDMRHVRGLLNVSSVSSPSGSLSLTGLGATSADYAKASARTGFSIAPRGLSGSVNAVQGLIDEGSSTIVIEEFTGSVGADMANHITTDTDLYFNFSYPIV